MEEIRTLFAAQHEREQAWAAALSPAEQHVLVTLLDKLVGARDDVAPRLRH